MFREKDFVTRMIKQLGAMFQQVLGLRRARKFEEAFQTLDGARQDLVLVPRALLDRVDAPAAAQLIGDVARVRVWARLLREEGEILRDQGLDPNHRFTAAAEVMLEATKRSAANDEDRQFLSELSRELPEGALAAGYAEQLRKLLA